MLNTKTLTLKAELIDAAGQIDWRTFSAIGVVSATRVSDGSPVPTSITVFETMGGGAGGGGPFADEMRFYNGVGSVSITLDNGPAEPPGDIMVQVTVGTASATRVVTVLDGGDPGIFRNLLGPLFGADLLWRPEDGVIHLVGDVTVGAGLTLTIQPGTIVMVDAGPPNAGTAILVNGGTVHAVGSREQPIAFFPTSGPLAMVLPQNTQNNPPSWRGFYHSGAGSSVYQWVFVAGAGNGIIVGHPRPPIFRMLDSYSVDIFDSVVADSPGNVMVAYLGASGTYRIQRSLFSRCGIGGEFIGSGYTAVLEDSWFTRIGRAPEPNGVDGDTLHFDHTGNVSIVRRCVLTDCGDDLIDQSTGATPVLENCIMYDARDKVVSLDGTGQITMTNCLAFSAPGNVRCAGAPAIITNCTFSGNSTVTGPNCTLSVFRNSIFWTTSIQTCCGLVSNTLVGNPSNLGCGLGNISMDPMFTNPAVGDYTLQPGSPALTAGPLGEQIGWLGFPVPNVCQSNGDCNDGDPCTDDSCDSGVCSYKPVICPPGILGDMNCDGLVNTLDIPAFALATIDAGAYASTYPGCNIRHGDTNGDTLVNGDDSQAFVALIIGP